MAGEDLSGDSLKKAQAYQRAQERAEKSLKSQQKVLEKLGGLFANIDGGEFFRNLTEGEVAIKTQELNSLLQGLEKESKKTAENLSSAFGDIAEKINLANMESSEMAELLSVPEDIAIKIKNSFDDTGKFIGNASVLIQDMGIYGKDFVKSITEELDLENDLVNKFTESHEKLIEINNDTNLLKESLGNVNETVFDMGKGFAAIGNNISSKLIPSLLEFDSTIKKSQLETGINFSENTTQMALLTSETARFGMNVGDTTAMMGDLSKELRTTNFAILSDATNDLAAMQKATGLASGDVAKLTKEFVNFGKSTKDVAKFSEEVMRDAATYGLNGKEVMEEMANSMSKMRNMGFTGGEQSLKKMVLESKRLGMSVDEIFDTAKRARNIEGAMEMASELQLAGGSFAQIDPMTLLASARKGPEELQKILGKMGSDIGHFDEATKKFTFDPVDTDRLQMVSDATGQSMDSLQNMIAKNAEDNQKIELLPPGMFGENLTDEEKAFLMNATKIGEGGKLEIAGNVEGIDNLENLTQEQIQAAMKAEGDKKKSLEEQAAQNMSFQETKDGLMASFTNLFSVFQPVLQMITDFMNWINGAPAIVKGIIGGAIAIFALMFGPAKAMMQGMWMARGFQSGMTQGGFFSKITGMLGVKGSGGASPTDAISKTASQGAEAGGASSGASGGLMGLAQGLKAMGNIQVFKGILAMAALAPVMVLFLPAIPGLLLLSVVGLMAAPLTAAFSALSNGFSIMGNNLSNILKGSLAMAIMGIALLPFVGAAYLMGQVDWLNVLAGVGVAALVVLGLMGLGMLLVAAWPLLLIGAAGLVLAGVSLLIGAATMALAGQLLMTVIEPLQLISAADWSGLMPFAAVLTSFGIGAMFGAIGLLAGAVALAIAAPLLAMAVAPLQTIASTDWTTLKSFADGLSYLGPAMIGFAAAGLALFNPLLLLGMVTMLGAITLLGSIMQTLGPNLAQGADGIERMAAGVIKLEEAVSALNTEKLASLRNLAFSMAEGGEGMGKMMAAVGGGKGAGGGESRVVHVIQLELDGKKLKEIELRDTKNLS